MFNISSSLHLLLTLLIYSLHRQPSLPSPPHPHLYISSPLHPYLLFLTVPPYPRPFPFSLLLTPFQAMGVLALLDEECLFPKASDSTYLEKLHKTHHGKSPNYIKPQFKSRGEQAHFEIAHYAGTVSETFFLVSFPNQEVAWEWD